MRSEAHHPDYATATETQRPPRRRYQGGGGPKARSHYGTNPPMLAPVADLMQRLDGQKANATNKKERPESLKRDDLGTPTSVSVDLYGPVHWYYTVGPVF